MLPTVQERLVLLQSWDLTEVRQFLEKDGMEAAEALAREAEYKKYMAINLVFPDSDHPISVEVDDFFHAHVLTSRNYARFCREVFGTFVHHVPIFSADGQATLNHSFRENTLPHLRQLFGEPSEKYWLNAATVCVASCHSGAGDDGHL